MGSVCTAVGARVGLVGPIVGNGVGAVGLAVGGMVGTSGNADGKAVGIVVGGLDVGSCVGENRMRFTDVLTAWIPTMPLHCLLDAQPSATE